MGTSAKAVANHFLKKYGETGITPLKIQKLVYIAHGWHLAVRGTPLVNDERAEAWEYGPVYASLYHEFKHRGRLPILDLATDFDENMKKFTPKIDHRDEDARKLLDRVWKVYGHMSGTQLSALCHQPGSPWDEARQMFPGIRNAHVDDDRIKIHYENKVERNRAIHNAIHTAAQPA